MSGVELKVGPCRWGDLWPEGEALFAAHRAEILADQPGIPYDMDFELAAQYDRLDIMQCVAAHANGALIGYCIFFISPSIESAGILCASQGPWFVEKRFRDLHVKHSTPGLLMWKAAIAALRARGVKHVLAHRYEHSDSRLDFFFARQGAKPFARVFSLVLEDLK